MNALRPPRLVPATIVLVLLCVLGGCECFHFPTSPFLHLFPPRRPTPPIPHADADDIVQVLATSMSADNGGWYLIVKRLADSLSVPAPNRVADTRRTNWTLPMSTRPHLQNDWTITGAGITYNLSVGYLQRDRSIASNRDMASSDLEAAITCNAGVFDTTAVGGCNGVNATYWLSAAPDSAILVSNLQPAAGDTMEFSGIFEDSCFALVHSTITPTSRRLWFPKNFVEFDVMIRKGNLVSSPYPIAGSDVRWDIEAFGMRSYNHNDWAFDVIVEARMTFDGSHDATLVLGNILPNPDWAYSYRVNLDTGHITRLN